MTSYDYHFQSPKNADLIPMFADSISMGSFIAGQVINNTWFADSTWVVTSG